MPETYFPGISIHIDQSKVCIQSWCCCKLLNPVSGNFTNDGFMAWEEISTWLFYFYYLKNTK